MPKVPPAARPLVEMCRQHRFFVGIDSDGCAFDTMEIKHKECFTPNIVKYWSLQAVSKYAREASEFVNLYSKWRGVNRWPALIKLFDLLQERAEVIRRGAQIPEAPRLREFIAAAEKGEAGIALSNEGLRAYMAMHPDPELERGLAWSEAVNASIADMVHGVPPFPFLRESLEFLRDKAEMIVVSATPTEALRREWEEHDITKYVQVIAGQEMGSKALHLELAAKGHYEPDHILMIGDAPGDLKAARANGALFFPINPGHEEQSWQRFSEEAVYRFLDGRYQGEYEQRLIEEFNTYMPEIPPWQR